MHSKAKPWESDRDIDAAQAAEIIEASWQDLKPVQAELLGEGWDNRVFRVNGHWVFRFPRRDVALPLQAAERSVLPWLAPQLPLPIPVPERFGEPSPAFPWPFIGHRLLVGQTACRANLNRAERTALAETLGEFLRALHQVDANAALRQGTPLDEFERLSAEIRRPPVLERLTILETAGKFDDLPAVMTCLDRAFTSGQEAMARVCLVHGDLYVRHLLLNDSNQACGVIDWGDIHVGNPATDLALAFGFLPPDSHGCFQKAYGPIDSSLWELARWRSIQHYTAIWWYGESIQDLDLAREGRQGLYWACELAL